MELDGTVLRLTVLQRTCRSVGAYCFLLTLKLLLQWDTYRTLYPLLSLHDPENFALIVRGMINIQQNEGWLPECRGATVQHYIQGSFLLDTSLIFRILYLFAVVNHMRMSI